MKKAMYRGREARKKRL